MKKFTKILLSAFCALSVFTMSACDTASFNGLLGITGNNQESASVGSGGQGDTSSGDTPFQETPERLEKMEAYNKLAASMAAMSVSGKTYKIGLDFDMTTVYHDGIECCGYVGTVDSQTITVEVDTYLQYAEDIFVDVEINANDVWNVTFIDPIMDPILKAQIDEAVREYERDPYGYLYAAAYLRSDYVYATEMESVSAITDAQKQNLGYVKTSTELLLEELYREMGIYPVPPAISSDNGSGTSVAEETTVDENLVRIAERASMNLLKGISGDVKNENGLMTVTMDLKAEAEKLYAVAEKIVDSITAETKISDLLQNEDLGNFYKEYLGDLTAADMQYVLNTIAEAEGDRIEFPAPQEGESGYQYLLNLLLKDLRESGEDEVIGNVEDRADFYEVLAEGKTYLDMINACEYSVSFTETTFRGYSMKVDIEGYVAYNFALTLDEVQYQFKDVSTLKIDDVYEYDSGYIV